MFTNYTKFHLDIHRYHSCIFHAAKTCFQILAWARGASSGIRFGYTLPASVDSRSTSIVNVNGVTRTDDCYPGISVLSIYNALKNKKKKKKKNETTEKKEMKKRTGANFGATDCTFSVQSAILSLVSPDSSIQQRPECLNPISI